MRITVSGEDQSINVLAPYVYSKSINNTRFINSGFEILQFKPINNQYKLFEVTEIFNRDAIPFIFPLTSSSIHNNDKINSVFGSPSSNVTSAVQITLTSFFSLFTIPCDQWVSLFIPSGIFYHPAFPSSVNGTKSLSSFCVTNQNDSSLQYFRQDGDMRINVSGQVGLYHVLVPYVYSKSTVNSRYMNSGWEKLDLNIDESVTKIDIKIINAIEFFNRAVEPFSWPSN